MSTRFSRLIVQEPPCRTSRRTADLHQTSSEVCPHFLKQVARILTLLCVSLTLGAARDVNRDNKALLRATSPFEDLVEFGLTKNEAAISKSLTEADRRAAVIREVIGSSASGKFDELLAALHQATTDRDHSKLAMSAVEAFRLLIDNLKPQGLQVPKEVSLLDYAGFKLQVLGAAPRPDWGAIRQVIGDAEGWWLTTKASVSDKALRDAFNSTLRGLQDAGKLENLPMLQFAARIDLDLVDLLERYFSRKR